MANNSNFSTKAKELFSRAASGIKLTVGRLGDSLSQLFARITGKPLRNNSGTRTSAKGGSAFRRRPAVLRAALCSAGARIASEPVRYRRGIEAAELFELAESERKAARRIAEGEPKDPAAKRGFFYRHRKGLIAACLVFALLFGGFQYLKGLYYSEDLFITDVEQTGNITISDRLTMSDEHADKVKYILILGVDDSSLLTDCIWIMCFDNAAHEMNVMQVPRDTYVDKDASWPHKINAVYASPKTVKWCEECGYAPDDEEIDGSRHSVCDTKLEKKKESNISALIRVINDRLGLPIDSFVVFNFRGFAKIIDKMGGVDIHLDYTVKDAAIHLEPGDHHLTGWPAVDFMRSRKGFLAGDVARVSNQRILIDALMQKALDMDLGTMLDVVVACATEECFQTDMSLSEIKDLAVAGRQMSVDKLTMVTMPGFDYWPKGGQSYYICDEAATAEMINQYLLPYGLPDGGMASTETINFPTPGEVPTTAATSASAEISQTTSTTAATDPGWVEPTEPTEDPNNTTEPTEPTGGESTTTTPPTSADTEPTSSTTTAAPTEPTAPPTEPTTTTSATTTTTTAAPTTTTTTAGFIIEDPGEAVGGSVTTPLSDPRWNAA